MEIPKDKNIDEIRELFEETDRIDVGVENMDGFEAKIGSDKRNFVMEVVEKNNVRFDNPARIQNGHPYILILPAV